jgi:hypothetical protein
VTPAESASTAAKRETPTRRRMSGFGDQPYLVVATALFAS